MAGKSGEERRHAVAARVRSKLRSALRMPAAAQCSTISASRPALYISGGASVLFRRIGEQMRVTRKRTAQAVVAQKTTLAKISTSQPHRGRHGDRLRRRCHKVCLCGALRRLQRSRAEVSSGPRKIISSGQPTPQSRDLKRVLCARVVQHSHTGMSWRCSSGQGRKTAAPARSPVVRRKRPLFGTTSTTSTSAQAQPSREAAIAAWDDYARRLSFYLAGKGENPDLQDARRIYGWR